jgi:hypothetical protein
MKGEGDIKADMAGHRVLLCKPGAAHTSRLARSARRGDAVALVTGRAKTQFRGLGRGGSARAEPGPKAGVPGSHLLNCLLLSLNSVMVLEVVES